MFIKLNHQFMVRMRRAVACLLVSVFSLFMLSAHAALSVNVDDRVSVSFTPLVVGQTAKDYTTSVVVTNTSLSDILSPIRVMISSIGQANISVSNADGSIGENAYIEISLPGGSLSTGDATVPATITFVRKAGQSTPNSSGNGNTKKGSFPTFSFESTILGGSTSALSAPVSSPSVLAVNSGNVDVAFKIRLEGDTSTASNLLLLRQDDGSSYPLNDDGISGDPVADDGVYGTLVTIDTATLIAEQCIPFVSSAEVDGVTVLSPVTDLCATSFPASIAASNTDPSNIIINTEGNDAVSDELVVVFVDGTSESEVAKTLAIYDAEVVGTLLKYGIYQVRLSESKSLKELERIISQLKQRDEVADATMNTIIEYASTPTDINFDLQHGLKLINADDAWDLGATGNGVTITIMDSGVDVSHEELDAVGKVSDPTTGDGTFAYAGQGLTDSANHGTTVAGIAAAETDNGVGIAGVARDSLIESIKIGVVERPPYTEFLNALAMVAQRGTGEIVNISSNVYVSASITADTICQIVNDIVFDGGSTPAKIVINAAGNNGIATANAYPGRCNVNVPDRLDGVTPRHTTFTDKSLMIPVANSISCDTTDTTDCVPAKVDTLFSTSNFGSWVDVAAPGTYLYAPKSGTVNGYDYGNGPDGTGSVLSDGNDFTNPAGTSFSAPMVAGAAAILRSCGVALDGIDAALKAGTLNDVDPDVAVVLPRIDLMEALESVNTAPTSISIDNASIDELAKPSETTTGAVTVGSLSAIDSNSCDTFTYSINSVLDGSSFQLSNDVLEVAVGVVLDFESKNSYNVSVRTTDNFGLVFDETLAISLNDVNDPPVVTSPSVVSIPENTTAVLTLAATDEDVPADTLTFNGTVTGVDGALFQVTGNQLSFIAAPDFETPADAGVDNTYNITVTLFDGATITDQNIVVTVTDVVETVSSASIDFDTRQDGAAYTGLGEAFPANEYNGVVINDSDPAPGSTFVNQINPVNVGTDISGYYVNIGAFATTPQTQLSLDFTTPVADVSFDYATPSGNLRVTAFDSSGTSIGVFNITGANLFVNQAGFDQNAGQANISGIGGIASLLIEPGLNQGLIVDNLSFTAP